ncbi:10744_t:CDS:1, partial [Ambispora gerdemannii]
SATIAADVQVSVGTDNVENVVFEPADVQAAIGDNIIFTCRTNG